MYLPIGVGRTAVGIVMILTHNAFDSVSAAAFGVFAPVWTVLHAPGIVYSDKTHVVLAAYVLIPWIGVTAVVALASAGLFNWEAARRKSFLLWTGLALDRRDRCSCAR